VRLEGLGPLKNPVSSSGIEPRDLPACSVVHQPTTLLRAPKTHNCILPDLKITISLVDPSVEKWCNLLPVW
jgi:hypothetical protein